MKTRTIASTWKSKPTMEGAGVLLKRAFSHDGVKDLDPFLLLDHFGSDRPEDYRAGFPFHPHRGMETITYLLEGEVEHQDSLGHVGTIGPGDVQWMRAGSGIIHQEMPKGDARRRNSGFQLWANLPSALKMSEPRYQDIKKSDIPVVKTDGGAEVRIICGEYEGQRGPARDIAIEPSYLDVSIPAGGTFRHAVPGGHTAFAYVFEGDQAGTLILFAKDGEGVEIEAGSQPTRFLLVSGQPLREPVAWSGPIVMNTHDELHNAFRELRAGTFVKHGLNAML